MCLLSAPHTCMLPLLSAAVRLRVEAGKRAAATAAVAAVAPASTAGVLLQPELAFSTGTYLMVPIYFILAFWPRSRVVRGAGDSEGSHQLTTKQLVVSILVRPGPGSMVCVMSRVAEQRHYHLLRLA